MHIYIYSKLHDSPEECYETYSTTKSIILGAKLKRENHFVGSITLAIRTDARREQLVFI